MIRFTLLALAVVAGASAADCIVLRKGNKLQLWGIASTIGNPPNQVEVTPENVEIYADQSTGVIDAEGYDGITGRKSPAAKQAESFPWPDVVNVYYSAEPEALVTAQDAMAVGNWADAIRDLKSVAESATERETFKYRALYQIGICYYNAGNLKAAVAHFKAWKPVNSRYTPEVHRFLAELYTDQGQFAAARAQYDEIAKLPGIPDAWKYKARLGAVRVDIAERKFDDAERTAQALARETQGREDLVDAHVLALVLQADAILRAQKAERYPDAEAVLARAAGIAGASPATRALLFVTQGHVIYAQGKPEGARFSYLRAAFMYPDSGYDGVAYQNAGQCFVDMSGRVRVNDPAKSDEYLVKGMQLLATAAGRYRNELARKSYAQNRQRYEEILAKRGGGAGAASEPAR